MRQTIDVRQIRMLEIIFLVQTLAQHRTPCNELQRGIILHVLVIFLRIDNCIEVSAIGNIDLEHP
ncbi:hypothetical protein D3C77_704300 [compost metagenome]